MINSKYTIYDITERGLFCDGDWIEKKDQDKNGNIRLIQLADIGDGYFIDKSNKYINEDTAKRLNCTFLKKGDILISRLGSPLGKACIFPLDGKCITAVDVAIVRIVDPSINRKYVMHLINSLEFRSKIVSYQTGTTRKRISRKNLAKITFELPPLPEQERIVAKIEELFSDLDDAVETLNVTKKQLEVYKQTVLYEAFFDLTDTVDMQEVATMIDPQPSHRTPIEVVGGIPYIGIGDIDYDNNVIKFDSARKVSESVLTEHLNRYTLSKGDFVMGKIGTIGKPYRIPMPQKYALSANVILIQPNRELIFPDFLYWQFSSYHVTSQLLKGANATSQPAFGIKKSRLLKIKMCDYEQQMAITSDIESKISVYESIANTVEKSLEEALAMRQSILKQAFEGRLL